MILYSFYKNIVLTMILFYYSFYTGFSGQSLFQDYVYSGYATLSCRFTPRDARREDCLLRRASHQQSPMCPYSGRVVPTRSVPPLH